MLTLKNKSSHFHIKNFSWLAAERFFRVIYALIISIFYFRSLSPSEFGSLSLSLSIVSILTPLSSLALSSFIVLDFIRSSKKLNLLKTLFILNLFFSFLCFILGSISTNILGYSKEIQMLTSILSLGLIFQTYSVFENFYLSQVGGKYIFYVSIISIMIGLPVKVFIISKHLPTHLFAISLTFDYFLMFTGYLLLLKLQKYRLAKAKFSFQISKEILKKSAFFIASSFFVVIFMKFDQIMISKMVNNSELGLYVAATKISEVFYLFPMILISAFYPSIVKSKMENLILYNQRHIQLYALMIFTSIIISTIISIYSREVIQVIFGSNFINAESALKIYIWSTVFVFIGSVNGKWLLTENYYKYIFINTLLGALLNILLNFLLIPLYGISGAAIATIISYAFSSFIVLFFWKKTRVSFFQILKSPFVFSKEIV
jgi:O-antigen/teichoic acid export membrane protein